MFRTFMTTTKDEADAAERDMIACIGKVDRWGRITDTLVAVERKEVERNGRIFYLVVPVVLNRDPLFDA